MKHGERYGKVLLAVNRFLVFFLIAAFLITCSIMLFVTVMTQTLGITLTNQDIGAAAKLTLINVIALSLLLTVIDILRRKLTVERPVKRITDAAKKMTEGDFSVRIPPMTSVHGQDAFNEIAECFNRMAEELSGSETLRADFIANVSHELKTPLSVIQNYGKMLQKPNLSESERLEYAKAVTDASSRLAALITNILKLHKLENQQILPRFESYDLGEQLCECMIAYEDAWEAKHLHIETDIEEDVFVFSDAEMMSIVFNNLLSNAIKFTEEGGTVGLRVWADGEEAVVEISDTGCGISSEVGQRIFDKFYQEDISHATEGNGLGLALVKRVIDLTGNTISVESTVGRGSTFTVRMRRATHV